MSDENGATSEWPACRCGHSGVGVVPNPDSGLCMRPTHSVVMSLFGITMPHASIVGCDPDFRRESRLPRSTKEQTAVAVDEWLSRR